MENSNDTITLENKTYNMLKARLEILTSLVEGQNDIIQGRTTTIEETFNSIDKMIQQLD
ncbi:antitoxin PHD [Veillonella sp.]